MTILQTTSRAGIGLSVQSASAIQAASKAASASNLVIRQSSPPPPIADRFGLSRAEIDVALDGLAELRRRRRRLLIVHAGVTLHGEREKRGRLRNCKALIGTNQKRVGMPYPEYLEILECTPSLHAHIIVSAPSRQAGNELIDNLNASQVYPELLAEWPDPMRGGIDALLSNYLLKEATPRVAFGIQRRIEAGTWTDAGFSRTPNAKRGPPITGDRVRVSKSLMGAVPAYSKTYAVRWIAAAENAVIDNAALAPPAPIWPPIQLGLPIAMPPPIDFRAIAEARRIEAGMTQREAAARIGIRQPHWSNTIQGKRDAFSAWRWNRIREFVGELGRAA